MPIIAQSFPNIAFIKYWGNRNEELRLPAADSLSMTLNSPHVKVTIDHREELSVHSFEIDGKEKSMTMQALMRISKHLDLTKQYLASIGSPDLIPQSVSLEIHSAIPPSIGLASSAAVFSCLAEAYAGLVKVKRELTREQVSVIARLGSGSAARSVYGGYAALQAGQGDGIDSAKGVQIAPETHWMLYDIIVMPSNQEKQYGSTEGHSFASTSPLFANRIAQMPRRQQMCIEAIQNKDFEKLQKVSEEDALDMHEVMRTSTPELHYLTHDSLRIVDAIQSYRQIKHLPVLYTMDAGPTVHLICTEEAKDEVLHFAHQEKDCTVFVAKTGAGSHIVG
jgi:diphosphomevalonate decarboxylase